MLWALLIALRGLDLRLLAFVEAPRYPLDATAWGWAIVAALGLWLLLGLARRQLTPATQGRLRAWLGPMLVMGAPLLVFWLRGAARVWALRTCLETALLWFGLGTMWTGPVLRRNGVTTGFLALLSLAELGLHLSEHILAHPFAPAWFRAGLSGAWLLAIFIGLFQLGRGRSSTARLGAWALALPLGIRVAGVGDWTALLGVTVPEGVAPYLLVAWGIAAFVLCTFSFPRRQGQSLALFCGYAGLVTCLVFLLFFFYLHRFGRLQDQFNLVSRNLWGVFLPYPEWHATAYSAAFAVTCVFLVALVLRCVVSPQHRLRGAALALWFCTGIGLDRSEDLVLLWIAVQGLSHVGAQTSATTRT